MPPSTKSTLQTIVDAFAKQTVLVVGDVILDAYMEGHAHRISPEAPVPIVDITAQEARLGGAANVALNLHALGAQVLLCSSVGADAPGEFLQELTKKATLDNSGLYADPTRKTTKKTRILAGGHHMLRIDEEIQTPLNKQQTGTLQRIIQDRIGRCTLVIFQDYDKGVLTRPLISYTIAEAKKHQIPTAVDPKRRQFFDYTGATLFKPNLKEFEEAMHFSWPKGDVKLLTQQANVLRKQLQLENILITLSAGGIYAQNDTKHLHESAHKRQIVDVSGAGDAVISVAALCMSIGLNMQHAISLANLAGGLVCETPGVIPITASNLLQHAAKLSSFTSKG